MLQDDMTWIGLTQIIARRKSLCTQPLRCGRSVVNRTICEDLSRIAAVACLTLSLAGAGPVLADSILPPGSYALISKNGSKVFAMFASTGPHVINGVSYTQGSGMYQTGKTPRLLWLFEGYSYKAILSRGGQYVVIPGGWASSFNAPAVSFFSKGHLLKTYKIGELVKDKSSVAHTVSHFFWRTWTGFYPDKNIYAIETHDGSTYFFDITTGKIIGSQVKELPDYAASVELTEGRRLEVHKLRQCADSISRHISLGAGSDLAISGFVGKEPAPGKPTVQKWVSIKFGHIGQIKNSGPGAKQQTHLKVFMRDGKSITLSVENIYSLCGLDKGNNKVHFRPDEIADMTSLHEIAPEAGTAQATQLAPELAALLRLRPVKSGWRRVKVKDEKPPDVQAATVISRRECKAGLAGYGRQAHGVCYDLVGNGWRGPLMVVVPAGGIFSKPFAIGKYEVTFGDWSKYCFFSGKCKPESNRDLFNMPVTGVNIKQVRNYLEWLSKRTGKSYRLPTTTQWRYAASVGGTFKEDSTAYRQLERGFNCRAMLGKRVLKGTRPVSVESGGTNKWGLKNFVSNVQEWAFGEDGLMAMGGAFSDDIKKCGIYLARPDSGKGDSITGFRVVLETIQ